jgi:hypothetical protein
VLAVLLALGAVMLAWRANGRANEAYDKASAAGVAPSQATAQPTEPPTTVPATEPTVEPTPDDTSTPTLDAQTKFTVKYAGKSLRISTSECASPTNIDLDEPRVGVEVVAREIRLGPPCGTVGYTISLNAGVDASRANSPDVQPAECADLIQLSPVTQDAPQPLRTGQVYCLTTSRDTAKTTANTWKMIVLQVTAIAADGTVTFKASAWDIPL